MQDETKPSPGSSSQGPLSGLLQSLTQCVATLLSMAQTRLELFTTELQEEIQRAAAILLWAFIALFAAGIGFFLLALLLIFAFWDTHRVLVSALVMLVFFAVALAAALFLRKQLRTRPRLLQATLEELARDKQQLDARLRQRS